MTRRSFCGEAITLGVAAAAASILLEGSARHAVAATDRAIKFSHGSGLCNMPLFYAAEKNLFAKYAIDADVVMTPMAGTSVIQLATGQVEMGVIPYTNTLAASTRSPTFSIVAGSGIQGLILLAKPEIKSLQELKGKKIGSFQADTLDILVLQRDFVTIHPGAPRCACDGTDMPRGYAAGYTARVPMPPAV